MRHLVDSHALLWYALADSRLSAAAKLLILDPANEILVSPASFWEMAIKVSIGKLTLRQPFEAFVDACRIQYGFVILPIEPKHIGALVPMPFHHKDPFDRMLVAQALVESIPIVSNDNQLDAYGVNRIW